MPRHRTNTSAGLMAFGAFGVLALTVTAIAIASSLADGPDAAPVVGPGTGPKATSSANPAPIPENVEVTPPEPPRPAKPRLQDVGAVAQPAAYVRQADANRSHVRVDLRRMYRSETRARLQRNPIYATGVMPRMNCRAPRPSMRPAAMHRFLHAVTNCLDRAWAAKFAQANALFLKPNRIYYARGGRGPCGTYPAPGAAAYYCPANRGMYIGLSHVIEYSGQVDPARNHVPYLALLGHEYAHHVQSMAGIKGAWWWEVSKASRSVRDAYSRRHELQAQCLSGIFNRSVRSSLGINAYRWQETLRIDYGRGDDQNNLGLRDHGSGRNFAAWLHHGYRYGRIAYCNTWLAKASDVS